jgi:hypothetical protein
MRNQCAKLGFERANALSTIPLAIKEIRRLV